MVFPPCNTSTLQQLPLDRKLKRLYLISVAQFRPEKNHKLQLEAFAHARRSALQDPNSEGVSEQWLFVGAFRNCVRVTSAMHLHHLLLVSIA